MLIYGSLDAYNSAVLTSCVNRTSADDGPFEPKDSSSMKCCDTIVDEEMCHSGWNPKIVVFLLRFTHDHLKRGWLRRIKCTAMPTI